MYWFEDDKELMKQYEQHVEDAALGFHIIKETAKLENWDRVTTDAKLYTLVCFFADDMEIDPATAMHDVIDAFNHLPPEKIEKIDEMETLH